MRKRLSIDEIVRSKDGKVDCRWCERPMPYKKVYGSMAKWSPAPYAWRCRRCGFFFLDGSINPNERTWDFYHKEDGKKRLSSYLSSVLRGRTKK